jgi:hypothetical protein
MKYTVIRVIIPAAIEPPATTLVRLRKTLACKIVLSTLFRTRIFLEASLDSNWRAFNPSLSVLASYPCVRELAVRAN